ncbi:hypothetical protein BJF92_02950 [Rhizobium rhizosphaerae]|uniref:DUF3018 family protein n=1 Tax=Xaviernesmea rhizosphaerae TaxID=1672749 RepID=A0A1Q9ACC6_9HYPH|nr:antitoxin MazE-like protein [Xaviernesmea rhizosphaerae]OLP52545.1 hypothetical protein BJF92_02950 [Xaviernesmea rhizosphaerae]
MGRPRELTGDERAELLRQGYRPVEIWVPEAEDTLLNARLSAEAERIAAADQTDDVTGWIEAAGPSEWDKP